MIRECGGIAALVGRGGEGGAHLVNRDRYENRWSTTCTEESNPAALSRLPRVGQRSGPPMADLLVEMRVLVRLIRSEGRPARVGC